MLQLLTGAHAPTDVEHENKTHGLIFLAEERNLLGMAVLEESEIGSGKPMHIAALLVHDADSDGLQVSVRLEHRPRRLCQRERHAQQGGQLRPLAKEAGGDHNDSAKVGQFRHGRVGLLAFAC